MTRQSIRFYFSFRSPYSFFGYYRFYHTMRDLDIGYELVPLSPPKKFTDKPIASPPKMKYLRQDIGRIATAYGINFKRPEPFDVNWKMPHAAFLYAQGQGKGLEFGYHAFIMRFCEGSDLSDDDVIKRTAMKCDLDPQEIILATKDKNLHKALLKYLIEAEERGVFGVPTFIYNNNLYWGNDRLEWLIRDIYKDQGKSCPNLQEDLLQRPF